MVFLQNVLVIGGGVSALDIGNDLKPVVQNLWQSTRNGLFDLPPSGVPVGEIAYFELQDDSGDSSNGQLPLTVHLKSGQKLCGIDRIIVCTGYHITIPFLSQYHEDNVTPEKASNTVLVTDGTMAHNLHYDIFYIPDPTLAFVGIPYYTATFSLFEFQAIVVAAVFSGVAKLPSSNQMREAYQERLRQQGSGKSFHSLKDKEEKYVRELLGWVNGDRAIFGLGPIEGHSDFWLAQKEKQRERIHLIFANKVNGGTNNDEKSVVEIKSTC